MANYRFLKTTMSMYKLRKEVSAGNFIEYDSNENYEKANQKLVCSLQLHL